jgi:hypothetical protein
MNNYIIPFDDFYKRRKEIESELNNVNNEINNITDKMTLLKYTTQKKLIEYQQAFHKKNEVDKLLSFHTSTNLMHPKMSTYDYTKELDKITDIYNKFLDKYINIVPKEFGPDINISFPELNRWKVDQLAEIRKEAHDKINENYIDFHDRELKIFENYQIQKNKFEWSIQQLEKDRNMSITQKNKKIKLVKNSITILEQHMHQHLEELTKTYPDLIKETHLIDKLSSNEVKNIPIKLDAEPENKPEVRLVKRKLILLNLKKQKCAQKISKVNDQLNNNMTRLEESNFYQTESDISQYNYSIINKKSEIKELRTEIKELDNYIKKLLESREVLIEEINLLESMESLTNNNVINELISGKSHFNLNIMEQNNSQQDNILTDIPTESVQQSDMIDILQLADNINIDNLDLNSINDIIENKFKIFSSIQKINNSALNTEENNKLFLNLLDGFDEMNPTKYRDETDEIDNKMDINNNFDVNIPNSTQIYLDNLKSKLKKLEETNIKSIINIQKSMNKAKIQKTNDNINKDIDFESELINELDLLETQSYERKQELINNDDNNGFDASDMELLRQFDIEMENDDFDSGFMELENNLIPQLEITKKSLKNNENCQNDIINSQLENLLQINDN